MIQLDLQRRVVQSKITEYNIVTFLPLGRSVTPGHPSPCQKDVCISEEEKHVQSLFHQLAFNTGVQASPLSLITLQKDLSQPQDCALSPPRPGDTDSISVSSHRLGMCESQAISHKT